MLRFVLDRVVSVDFILLYFCKFHDYIELELDVFIQKSTLLHDFGLSFGLTRGHFYQIPYKTGYEGMKLYTF